MDFQNIDFLQLALAVVALLLTLSELLAFIPSIKSNSNLQLVYNSLLKVKDFLLGLVKKPEAK